MEKEFDTLALGEILLRLSAPDNERIVRGDTFQKCVGGAELNVVSGISLLGLRTGIISKIPSNDIGTYAKNRIRFCNVSDDYLIYDESKDARLGVYYYENGAYPRKASVVYDRKFTSINRINLDEIPESAYSNTRLFHTSGITLALSEQSRTVALEMIKRFKKAGAMISFDVNFRANLWSESEAKSYIEEILPYIDVLFVSEETARRTFKKTGDIKKMMKSFTEDYTISIVASTERKVISPKKHTFSSTIYNAKEDKYYFEAPYEKIEVVDRIGSGDAYVAGALYGLLKYNDCQKALEYGNAASAVKNTISGDLPSTDLKELDNIIKSHQNIGEQSEMNR
ncbi:MAG: sugar kinase [Lachnotalea sp.]